MLYFAGAEIKVNKNFCLFSIEVGVFLFVSFFSSFLFPFSILPGNGFYSHPQPTVVSICSTVWDGRTLRNSDGHTGVWGRAWLQWEPIQLLVDLSNLAPAAFEVKAAFGSNWDTRHLLVARKQLDGFWGFGFRKAAPSWLWDSAPPLESPCCISPFRV